MNIDWGLVLILATSVSGLIGSIIDTHNRDTEQKPKEWYKRFYKTIRSLSTLGKVNTIILIFLLLASIVDYYSKKEDTDKLVRENNIIKFSSLKLGTDLHVVINFKNSLPYNKQMRQSEIQSRQDKLKALHDNEITNVKQNIGPEKYDKISNDLLMTYTIENSYYSSNYFDSTIREYLFPGFFNGNSEVSVQSDLDFFNKPGPIDLNLNFGRLIQFSLTIFHDGLGRPMIHITGNSPADFKRDVEATTFLMEKSFDYKFDSNYSYNGGSIFETYYFDNELDDSKSRILIKDVNEDLVRGINRSLDEV